MRDFTDVYELQSFVMDDMQDVVDLAPTTISEKAGDLFNKAFADYCDICFLLVHFL